MSHASAAFDSRHRLSIARLIIGQGPLSRVAEQFSCSWPTAKWWAARYATMGDPGMADRHSRPQRLVRKVVHVRRKQRLGPVAIGAKLALPASTVVLFWSGPD